MEVEGRGVQSIEMGAQLLEVLAATGRPMMLRDIALSAGVAPAQAHAYIVSYRKSGLVEQDQRTGLYRLGPFALQLALAKLRSFDPIGVASQASQALVDETGLSVAIVVWGAYGPTVVRVIEGFGQVHMNTRPGTVYSLTGTASGRVFMCYLPTELVNATVKFQKAEGIRMRFVGGVIDVREIAGELASIREHGYSSIDSAPIPGISAISAPVFDISGELSLALTLIGASDVLDISASSEHLRKLMTTVTDASAQLGHFGVPAKADTAGAAPTAKPRRTRRGATASAKASTGDVD